MMIAARLAGGNLFFAFFVVEGLLGAARSTRIFLRGILWWGIFGSTRSSSEQLGALGFFLRGFVVGGFFFLWGVVGCVLDCKCWKKLKND